MSRKNKQDPDNIQLLEGESWSIEYRGFILKSSGEFKKVIKSTIQNKNKRNYCNRYFIEVTCYVCLKKYLQDKTNYKKGCLPTCSKQCWVSLKTKSIGTVKLHKYSKYIGIKLPEHPRAGNDGYVREHILVMEKHLNRPITKEEHVHHIDMDKFNNSIENLHLFSNQSNHFKAHGSLNSCVKKLIQKGYLGFDKESATYFVIDKG
ncbi:MAG: HNH endonuclease [Anaerolineales bacterium]|nr:HNH endonuclease [Anaerolineales bacterium]